MTLRNSTLSAGRIPRKENAMPMTQASTMQQCIDDCLHCYRTCLQTAMHHCLEAGGQHTEPEHFRLMTSCAEICRTSAHFMLTGTHLHSYVCSACAEICHACAESCMQIGEMDECVQACRTCEQSCRAMADEGAGMQPHSSMQPGFQDQLPM